MAGHATRHGSAATSTAPARRDDELVKRLRRAGAVVVGKTRMPELAVWGFTQSALGFTRNPRSPARDPGGSSGGSAAAVAAGMAALALGTDGGGSIRIPAAYCGLVGLKPGAGEVPLPGGADEHWFGLSAAGPLARTCADAAVMFAVLAGRDAAAARHAVEAGAALRRVAVSLRSPSPVAELTAENRLATVGAAVLLREGGAVLAAEDPPYSGSTASHWSVRWQAGVAREAADLGLDLDAVEPRTATVVRNGRGVLRLGGPRPATAAAWRERVLAWFDAGRHDVLLTPAVAGPPVRAGAMRHRGYLSTTMLSASRVPYTQAWNLAGVPAVVVPVCVSGRAGGGPAGGPAGRRAGAAGDGGTDRGPGGPRRPAGPDHHRGDQRSVIRPVPLRTSPITAADTPACGQLRHRRRARSGSAPNSRPPEVWASASSSTSISP